MKAIFLTLAGVAAASALAIGANSALAASHTPGTGARVAVANSTLGRVLVDGRGRTLYLFAKDKHGQQRLHRAMRRLLAAADHVRQAARNGRSTGLPARNHEASRRTPAGHLQPSPALHVRQGHRARARRTARRLTPSAPTGTRSRPPGPRSRTTTPGTAAPAPRQAAATATRRRRHEGEGRPQRLPSPSPASPNRRTPRKGLRP